MRQRHPRQHLPLPRVSREAYFASLGHPRQPGRWTAQTMLIALGLYVREEHRLPPQRHLHNSEYLPSYDTAVSVFGSVGAYYAALPRAWRAPDRPAQRAQYPPRQGRVKPTRAGKLECRRCDALFASVDTVLNRICPLCTLKNAEEDGLWLTGEAVVVGGDFEEEVAYD